MRLDEIEMQNRTLAADVLERAEKRGCTLGSAESCTGGMIASALTAIPGSSQAYVGGVVSYWIDVKERVLGVSDSDIETYGVVSSEVAAAMAQGARKTLGCDYAVSTTGIAGPTGSEPGKPVGTVWFGIATPQGVHTFMTCNGQSRDEIRALAVNTVLHKLLAAIQ
jgi:PncC family amidohydrolase